MIDFLPDSAFEDAAARYAYEAREDAAHERARAALAAWNQAVFSWRAAAAAQKCEQEANIAWYEILSLIVGKLDGYGSPACQAHGI